METDQDTYMIVAGKTDSRTLIDGYENSSNQFCETTPVPFLYAFENGVIKWKKFFTEIVQPSGRLGIITAIKFPIHNANQSYFYVTIEATTADATKASFMYLQVEKTTGNILQTLMSEGYHKAPDPQSIMVMHQTGQSYGHIYGLTQTNNPGTTPLFQIYCIKTNEQSNNLLKLSLESQL